MTLAAPTEQEVAAARVQLLWLCDSDRNATVNETARNLHCVGEFVFWLRTFIPDAPGREATIQAILTLARHEYGNAPAH